MNLPQRGDQVVLRGYGDVAYVRRVWDYSYYKGAVVNVYNDQAYALAKRGHPNLMTLGFRWEWVYLMPDGVNPSEIEGKPIDSLNLKHISACANAAEAVCAR